MHTRKRGIVFLHVFAKIPLMCIIQIDAKFRSVFYLVLPMIRILSSYKELSPSLTVIDVFVFEICYLRLSIKTKLNDYMSFSPAIATFPEILL